MEQSDQKASLFVRLATRIVDKRSLFFLIYAAALIVLRHGKQRPPAPRQEQQPAVAGVSMNTASGAAETASGPFLRKFAAPAPSPPALPPLRPDKTAEFRRGGQNPRRRGPSFFKFR